MSRVKRGTISVKRRRNILKQTKGFRWGGKSKERQAHERLFHAGSHAFQDRRKKKRNFRRLWQININAALRSAANLSYSKFIHQLKISHIAINRKMLAEVAKKKPEVFAKIVEAAKK